MNPDVYGCTVGFLSLNSFYINRKFLPIDLNNFANLLPFEMASYYLLKNFIILIILKIKNIP